MCCCTSVPKPLERWRRRARGSADARAWGAGEGRSPLCGVQGSAAVNGMVLSSFYRVSENLRVGTEAENTRGILCCVFGALRVCE